MFHLLAEAQTQVLQLDMTVLNMLSGTLMPIVTRLVTKEVTARGTRAAVNALLSAAAGGIAVAIASNGAITDVSQWVTSMGITFITGIAAYNGLWEPTGTTDKVGTIAPEFGIGRPPVIEFEEATTPVEEPSE